MPAKKEIPNYIKEAYNNKQESCISRAISFDFTLEEFYAFHKLKESVTCFYSNRQFNSNKPKKGSLFDDRPTIERVDDSQGYSLDNCVWTTSTMNSLKNDYIFLNGDDSQADISHVSYIARIRKILSQDWKKLPQYLPYQSLQTDTESENVKAAKAHKAKQDKLKEVYLCDMYAPLAKQLLVELQADFNMSFSEFKRQMTVKRCKLTKKELPEDVRKRSLWIKNKRLTINTENVVCTTTELANALDTFSVNADLDYETMGKLFNNI